MLELLMDKLARVVRTCTGRIFRTSGGALAEKGRPAHRKEGSPHARKRSVIGEYSFDDFLKQADRMKEMEPIRDLLKRIPRLACQINEFRFDDDDLRRIRGMVRSMTSEERRCPEVIGEGRRWRIARGSVPGRRTFPPW